MNFSVQKKIATLVLLGVIMFFGVGVAHQVSAQTAGCKFEIKSMWAQPENVSRSSRVYFQAQVDRVGVGPVCENVDKVNFRFYVTEGLSGGRIGDWLINREVSFAGKGSVTIDGSKDPAWAYDLISFQHWGELPNPNELEYVLSVMPQIGGISETNTLQWRKKLTVSGQTTGSGNPNVIDAVVSFDKAIVRPGDAFKVYVEITPENINKLPAKVAVLTYLDGKQVGNHYGTDGKGIPRDQLKYGQTYQTLTATESLGFKDNANIIRVDIQDASAPYYMYARGTATITGGGFDAPADPKGGTPADPKDGTPADPKSGPPGPVNPIQDTSLLDLFLRLLKVAIGVLGALTVGMIVVGGFKMVLANGNETAYESAKKTITWAVIGLVVALLSFSMIAIVQNVLKADIPDANTELRT